MGSRMGSFEEQVLNNTKKIKGVGPSTMDAVGEGTVLAPPVPAPVAPAPIIPPVSTRDELNKEEKPEFDYLDLDTSKKIGGLYRQIETIQSDSVKADPKFDSKIKAAKKTLEAGMQKVEDRETRINMIQAFVKLAGSIFAYNQGMNLDLEFKDANLDRDFNRAVADYNDELKGLSATREEELAASKDKKKAKISRLKSRIDELEGKRKGQVKVNQEEKDLAERLDQEGRQNVEKREFKKITENLKEAAKDKAKANEILGLVAQLEDENIDDEVKEGIEQKLIGVAQSPLGEEPLFTIPLVGWSFGGSKGKLLKDIKKEAQSTVDKEVEITAPKAPTDGVPPIPEPAPKEDTGPHGARVTQNGVNYIWNGSTYVAE